MKFTNNANANMTGLKGEFPITFAELVEIFGRPKYGPNAVLDKTTCEWALEFEDGTIATIYDYKTTWATLKNEDPPVRLGSIVNHLMLRARANSQRHYEIYTMNVEEGIADEDICVMFEQDPQGSADLIRDRGNKIYSDRENLVDRKII